MSDLETEPRPSRRLWVFAAAAALALHLGCGALAIAHLREAESDDDTRRQCDRGRHRIRVGAPRGHRPAAGTGHRCVGGVAGAGRAAGRGQGDRAAEGHADRARGGRPAGDAERVEQAQGRGYQDRRGADPGLHRVGGLGSHRDAELRSDPGRAAFGRARDRQRRDRAAGARDLAEGTGRPSRQAQALSGRSACRRAPRVMVNVRARPHRAACSRATHRRRDPATPPSTTRRSRC